MQLTGNTTCPPLRRPAKSVLLLGGWWYLVRALLVLGVAFGGGIRVKMTAATNEVDARTRFAESEFQRTRAVYETNRTDIVSAWQFAKACFDRAELSSGDKQRASLAELGIAAGRSALARTPTNAAVSYYLALNLGQLARTKGIGALKLVKEMEELFHRARTLDETLDHAGPDRTLGLLYQDAPGWPTSVGSKKKSLIHLRRAVELAADFPENRLNLAEALLLHHRDRAGAQEQLRALEQDWESAKARYAGPEWAYAWSSWQTQRKSIEHRLADTARGR